MIQLTNVSKLYAKVIGVNDLTFDFGGGAYGLVGPNGSGKTTLINLITGQLRPTLGTVKVFDRNPWRDRRVLRRIGLCPATDVLYPNVSALEWVTYQVRLHGFSRKKSREHAVASLEQVSMTRDMHRPMGEYSLGMRQRTKIAQAIAHQPELLILDEPYNGLDPVGRYQMTELLKTLVQEGKSLIFASHVLHEIEAVTSAFILIYGGRLLASGTTAEIETMLAGTPQEVELHGEDAPKLIRHLADQSWVESLQLLENRRVLRVALLDASELYQSLATWVSQDGLRIDRFESAGSSLTTVFDCLLRHHRGEF